MSEGKKEYRPPRAIPWIEIPIDTYGIRIYHTNEVPGQFASLVYYPAIDIYHKYPKPETE